MRQPVGQRSIAGWHVGPGEEVDHSGSAFGSWSARFKTVHRCDDRNETLEPEAAEGPPLESADRGLIQATPPGQLPLGPAKRDASALDHRADDLPAGLDLRVSIATVGSAPGHGATLASMSALVDDHRCTGAHLMSPTDINHRSAGRRRKVDIRNDCSVAGERWAGERWAGQARGRGSAGPGKRWAGEAPADPGLYSSTAYARNVRKSANSSSRTRWSSRSQASLSRPAATPPRRASSSSRMAA